MTRELQKGIILFAILLALSITSISGITVYASQKALPGDTLYPVKELTENIRVVSATNASQKAQVYLDLAQEKNRELEVLQEKGASEGKITKVIEKIQNYNQKVAELLGQAQDRGQDVSKEVENLKENTKRQKQSLEKVIEKASDKVKEAAQQTIETTQKTVESVLQPTSSSTTTSTPSPTTTTTPTLEPSFSPSATVKPTTTPSPTPKPTSSPTPTPAPTVAPTPTPSSKPDLVITSMNTISSMKSGNWNYFKVAVKNQGTEKYFYSSNIYLTITGSGDETSCEVGLTSISPGESSTFDLYCIAYRSGNHTATAKVDANNRIDESNESNNTYSIQFYVSP